MAFYDHKCLNKKCGSISDHMYSMSRDPKEIKCPECGSDTERLIGKVHIGWERRVLKTFVNGEDERSEAMVIDHMGPKPYESMSGEEM